MPDVFVKALCCARRLDEQHPDFHVRRRSLVTLKRRVKSRIRAWSTCELYLVRRMMAHVERSGARDRTGVTMHDARFNNQNTKKGLRLRPVSRQLDSQAV